MSAGLGLLGVVVGLALLSRSPSLARSEAASLGLSVGILVAVLLASFTGELERRRRALLLTIAGALLLIPALGWLAAAVVPGVIEGLAVLAGLALIVGCRRAPE